MVKTTPPVHYESVDQYIKNQPEVVKDCLHAIERCIQSAAPGAKKVISYNIPTYVFKRPLAHFAAYKKHIGFYPGSAAIVHFKDQLTPFVHAKGSVQFPLDRPLPLQLIHDMVVFNLNLQQPNK